MIDLYYIEDDSGIAWIVKEYLEQKNFKVTICATLAQARQAFMEHVPTLVLLDWNMPDGHGEDLCRWIRRNWKELPVIFLTVRGDCADIFGFWHCFAEPVMWQSNIFPVMESGWI